MPVDRDLLWKAWPEGYLAMRGVSAVCGWLCTGSQDGKPQWDAEVNVRDWAWFSLCYSAGLEKGDLLPNVDPADVATWACVKEDLARAVGWPVSGELLWRRDADAVWYLGEQGGAWHSFPGLKDDTRAEALVRARIQLREEAGR